jgi:inosine-uridine nucleoside N-ribohydrolase
VLVHLDTDFAGDTDDAAALAMLLGWPDVELTGVTTTADPDGARAGYAAFLLGLAGRDDIPVEAGAGVSPAGAPMGELPDHEAFWGRAAVTPKPRRDDAATALMAEGIERGATVVAVGPYTNLAWLEAERPGILSGARVVLMGGWVHRAAEGLPQWGPERDWNVQCDTAATQQVFAAAGELTLATLTGTLRAHLRVAHLDRLEASGPIGRLLARQGRAHGAEHRMTELGRAHAGLPDDLLNFQYDPVACAVAVGWTGAKTATLALRPAVDDGVLRFEPADAGTERRIDVVLDVDGTDFAETWLRAIERADRLA